MRLMIAILAMALTVSGLVACATEADTLPPTAAAPPGTATRTPTLVNRPPDRQPTIVAPAVGSIDQNVRELVAMQGPNPSDEEISQACDALRKAGWEYMGIGATNNRTTMIAASITTFASGDRLAEYCNSFPLTVVPIVVPTLDIESTKRAIAVADQQRRDAELATRVATEAKQEADRFAASLEATRTTELAIQEATRVAETTMVQTTRVAEIDALCQQWEPMVLAWVKEGNYYHVSNPATPFLPDLSVQLADANCDTGFPHGLLAHTGGRGVKVGTGAGQLLPGTYQYQAPSGDNRVETIRCKVSVNQMDARENSIIDMVKGEPFEIGFDPRHNFVSVLNWNYGGCSGFLHRVGD